MKIVLATRNQGKIVELRRILAGDGDAAHVDGPGPEVFDVVGLEEFPDAPEVPETELTFEGNALLKARAIAAYTGLPAVADDSGLCVDVLGGMPGVLSARWSGRFGDAAGDKDRANLELLLDQLGDVAARHRTAHFACAAAFVLPSGEEHVVEGRMDGRVIEAPRGSGGFGYDPLFVPDGESRTTAELPPADKDAISHRGRAFRALAPVIDRYRDRDRRKTPGA
ncbi:RdgB/HAM1 family non-canonical purine NTP pyrophosphatase [Actinomadura sp. HBU206391]|uniref:RdgB/HAM1 family non-canonical purine NTP pyrophosphatase n=1 Tax=Actinomadura sp. HBU206391 TaxID=2731692 RepID=UPI00164F964D|nr:RdgB/HAM1 family non-canonical purine NTP pyrophosphatase [Actinomadura sp. HBU206391]MBC6457996.1 RdgB/HAM1 family non-canonical purine NTP pyrophosphatase [Actinomadura sp. HBU206391]